MHEYLKQKMLLNVLYFIQKLLSYMFSQIYTLIYKVYPIHGPL